MNNFQLYYKYQIDIYNFPFNYKRKIKPYDQLNHI